MSEAVIDDIVAVLPPLLQSLEALTYIGRHLDPLALGPVLQAAGRPDHTLRNARSRLTPWPDTFADLRAALDAANDAALAGFDALYAALGAGGDLRAVFRALRYLPRAQEALYPLAARLPPVSDFFVDPTRRDDAELKTLLAQPAAEDTGVFHFDNDLGSRGGFSCYVPEYYRPDRVWPLMMALHGGSGNGRSFLWSWLRDARSFGAIVVAPTAIGGTWALMGDDPDTPNVTRILDLVRARWTIDPGKMLLTGMSDGGTFCYVTGLERSSPFTHLAPIAATFHPLMAEVADAERLQELPIFLTHGRQDWMFPVEVARQAQQALSSAGADVIYREIDDLAHSYPREINAELLCWLESD